MFSGSGPAACMLTLSLWSYVVCASYSCTPTGTMLHVHVVQLQCALWTSWVAHRYLAWLNCLRHISHVTTLKLVIDIDTQWGLGGCSLYNFGTARTSGSTSSLVASRALDAGARPRPHERTSHHLDQEHDARCTKRTSASTSPSSHDALDGRSGDPCLEDTLMTYVCARSSFHTFAALRGTSKSNAVTPVEHYRCTQRYGFPC